MEDADPSETTDETTWGRLFVFIAPLSKELSIFRRNLSICQQLAAGRSVDRSAERFVSGVAELNRV